MLFTEIFEDPAEIEQELSECRQDERDSQNQILQVISAAATVLSVILGASALFPDSDYISHFCCADILFVHSVASLSE